MWKVDAFSTDTVYTVKCMLQQKMQKQILSQAKIRSFEYNGDLHPDVPKIEELHLHYSNKNMKNDKTLSDYGINGGILSAISTQLVSNENLRSRRLGETNRAANLNSTGGITDRTTAYDVTLIVTKKSNGKINIGIDLSFNKIKDVS